MSRDYSIVTGYWNGNNSWKAEDLEFKKNFFDIWYKNTNRHSNPKNIFVINSGSESLPEQKLGNWIDLSFNLGHVHDLDTNSYPHKKFCGWSMSFILGAYLCYANNTDMIFKEQDCLAFGNWVDIIYDELDKKNKKMLFGKPEHADNQGLEQSLFIIKHEYLLDFVGKYASLNVNDAGVNHVRPERKFKYLLDSYYSDVYSYLPFGYGRSRPLNFNENVFYLQQIKKDELLVLPI